MAYWLIKSEPSVYPWSQLVADGETFWDGVRNFEARNLLRSMKLDDRCFFYHSNEGKEIVGIAKVVKESYADPTQEAGEDWVVVNVAPVEPLPTPISLATLKADPALANLQMLKRLRLSVTRVTDEEWLYLCKLGGL